MHDRNGLPLQVGDLVLIPCRVTQLTSSEDFCNVTAVSAYGRRPDDQRESFSAINTGVLLRANGGDAYTPCLNELLAATSAD